jgi:hypothetical protein
MERPNSPNSLQKSMPSKGVVTAANKNSKGPMGGFVEACSKWIMMHPNPSWRKRHGCAENGKMARRGGGGGSAGVRGDCSGSSGSYCGLICFHNMSSQPRAFGPAALKQVWY